MKYFKQNLLSAIINRAYSDYTLGQKVTKIKGKIGGRFTFQVDIIQFIFIGQCHNILKVR